ncbi:MAG: GNAT family N-acetyltransferase [Planctomycetes bacterium]|nr:GNAT family N-acetyltransferase [Planctomycetota bacterium]
MIRPTDPADTPFLLALTEQTGVFRPMEIQALREVLDDYHDHNRAAGHRCVTHASGDRIAGFAYYAPAAMTVHTWYLYWIAIQRDHQAQGIGSELLRFVEADIRIHQPAAVLLIETSSMPSYDLTRGFYKKHGYEIEAVLRDYYAPGDDMIVFRKSLDRA